MNKNFLKKVILVLVSVFILCICYLNNQGVNASVITNYNFIPQGINYLDPKNLVYTSTDNGYTISTKELIMINEKTEYYIEVYDNLGYFDGGEVVIYDEAGNRQIILSQELKSGKDIAKYTGDQGVAYLSFAINVTYYNTSDLSKKCNLIMYDEDADIENATASDLIYQGKDGLLIVEKEYDYYTNASDPITLDELYEDIKVYDDVDGDISDLKTITNDTYSSNFGKVGTWIVEYYVEDKGGNPATLKVYIHVVDDIAPVIEGPELLEIAHNEPKTEQEIISLLTATDNALGNITSSIEVVSNSYKNNESNVGSYEVVFRVSDGVNITEYTVMINVFYNDIYKPVFSGDFEIEVGNNTNIDIYQLISNINVADDVDDDLEIRITYDDYTDNIGKVGRYKVTLSATDSKNNTATQDIYITIKDKTPPVYMIYSKNIYLNASVNIATTSDLITYMKKTNNLDNNMNYEVIYDEYSENKNTPGRYRVVFENNDIKTGVVVEVVDKMYEVEDDISFFVRVKTFFSNIFSTIGDFFRSIF